MRLVGILGLLALLGIAFLISNNRLKIRPRVMIWGLGLQFVFAMIVLRHDYLSFVGMGILVLLLLVYVLQNESKRFGKTWLSWFVILGVSALTAQLLYLLPKSLVVYPVLIALLFMVINWLFKWKREFQKYATAIFFIAGFVTLVAYGLYGRVIFQSLADKVSVFLSLSDFGAKFLFGNLVDSKFFFVSKDSVWPGFGFQFAFKILPTIIFFSAFISILYYLGIMQKVIEALAKFMKWTIGTSGAETLSCSANIFVGQTEAPLLIKPFLDGMTKSELTTIMVGGFATIAGGVLAGYIAMGVPADHLIAATVMSAPAALVVGKMIYPETEVSQTSGEAKMPTVKAGANVVEATANGIIDGLKLAVNVGAMLIGFIALIALVDVILNGLDYYIDYKLLNGEYFEYAASGMTPAVGEYKGIFPGSLQTLFGWILSPLAWLMGVPWKYAGIVGNLLGIKVSLNEFVAYGTLGVYIQTKVLNERAIIIATYALCGFANFGSIGIQIGGISALAPGRKTDLAKVGVKAMVGGAIASWLTATIAGILL